jgi:hypothetical protein
MINRDCSWQPDYGTSGVRSNLANVVTHIYGKLGLGDR